VARIILDASIALAYLLREQGYEAIEEQLSHWSREGIEICVPAFFFSEVMNGIRRSVVRNLMQETEGDTAFHSLELFPARSLATPQPFEHAWNLAKSFHLPATYDAEYMALAERESSEFWTSDRRLINSLGNQRPTWIREVL